MESNKDQNQGKSKETFKVTGNWEAQSKKLKGQYTQLTDSDLKFEPGNEEQMLKRVENKLNKNRQEVIGIINHTQTEKN